MLQADVETGKLYRICDERWYRASFCKIKMYGQTWCMPKAVNYEMMSGGSEIIKRYPFAQAVLVVEGPDPNSHRFKVLLGGEILTMHGRAWKSVIEVDEE